jgi:endonuclease/exonuclease/phosphatase family metal-dependent hydrolase
MAILRFIKNIVWTTNMVVALGLLLTYLAPYTNPAWFWLPAMFGLLYPFMLVLNVGFVVFWLIRRNYKYAILSIAVILSGYPILGVWWAMHPFGSQDAGKKKDNALRVMSYNVRNFDLYNWNKNQESRNNMLNLIKLENPDIICFQDFYTQEDTIFNNVAKLTQELGYPHYYFKNTTTVKEKNKFGAAIFSKHPLSNFKHLEIQQAGTNTIAFADADIKGQKVRVFTVHLQSTYLANKDIRYVSELMEAQDKTKKATGKTDHFKSVLSIVQKLKGGYIKRSQQAQLLAAEIEKSPYPVIVCGDFNDTPISYTYKMVSQVPRLQDTFLANSFGIGATFHGLSPLKFRIDYIFAEKSIKVNNFHILRKTYSDHYPIVCDMELGGAGATP